MGGRLQQTAHEPHWLASRLWFTLGIVLVWGFWYAPSTTGDELGIRRFRTPEITGEMRIAQQFVMRERMLTGVEIRPSVVGDVGGTLRFTVTDQTSEQVIQSVNVSARDVVKDDWFPLTIGRIDDSNGHWFELAIASAPEDPARGVAFWATRGDRLPNAMLLINGAERWADLTFRTRTPVMSMIDGLLTPSAGLGSRILLAGALAAAWVFVGIVLRQLAAIAGVPQVAERTA